MIDIDHFKRINDTYGHLAGDDVLKAVAKTVSNALRSSDILARLGGEEFVAILPKTDMRGAVMVAEKIRESIEHDIKSPCTVTASFGTSTWTDSLTSEELLRRADEAMYQAKKMGRNRVVAYETRLF